jgi:hypothetical protein
MPTPDTTRLCRRIFPVLLASHALTGLAVVALHLAIPYGHGRMVAQFITERGWSAQPVAGIGDSLTAVCGYLRQTRCYFADRDRWSSHFIYDGPPISTKKSPDHIKAEQLSQLAALARLDGPVTFLAPETWLLDEPTMNRHGFEKAADFSIAIEDNFIIYRRNESAR